MDRNDREAAVRFVRAATEPRPVPLVPRIRVCTAHELTPVWTEIGEDIPFWCVPWAGGQAVARYVLDRPETVRGKHVMDLGSGGGVVAIAASLTATVPELSLIHI